jgi:hypothetical protein
LWRTLIIKLGTERTLLTTAVFKLLLEVMHSEARFWKANLAAVGED